MTAALPFLAALLAAQPAPAVQPAPAAQAPAEPAGAEEQRFDECIAAIGTDPAGAVDLADRWRLAGGGIPARQCQGLAYAAAGRYAAAATALEAAARASETARDGRAARLWTQAGNARLAAGDASGAVPALDAALAAGSTEGELLGEIHLDRARALVAAGRQAEARADLDAATRLAPRDPLGWLLSATLARRLDDLDRAAADIAEATARSPDDASVAVEAGLIAAARGDDAAARTAWQGATRLQPASRAAAQARDLLAQLDGTAAPTPSVPVEGR